MKEQNLIPKKFFDFGGGGIVIFITAPRGSGKSTLVCGSQKLKKTGLLTNPNLLQFQFDYIFLIHKAYDKDFAYHALKLNENHILEDCDFDTIDSIYSWCKQQWNIDNSIHSLIILEDCLADLQSLKNKRNGNVLDEIVANSRGYNISLMISTQMYKSVSTTVRGGIDYLIAFDTRTRSERENIIDDFCFPRFDKHQFKDIWEFCTKEQFSPIVLDCRAGKQHIYKGFNKLKV